MGPENVEEKICIFGKKSVGPENVEEKICIFGKKLWVGTKLHPEQIFGIPSANFFLTPPLLVLKFSLLLFYVLVNLLIRTQFKRTKRVRFEY